MTAEEIKHRLTPWVAALRIAAREPEGADDRTASRCNKGEPRFAFGLFCAPILSDATPGFRAVAAVAGIEPN
jgi:hypothetical protein